MWLEGRGEAGRSSIIQPYPERDGSCPRAFSTEGSLSVLCLQAADRKPGEGLEGCSSPRLRSCLWQGRHKKQTYLRHVLADLWSVECGEKEIASVQNDFEAFDQSS